MRLVERVQHSTIKPCIEATSAPGTGIAPDEDEIYSRLEPWGDAHQTVCHGRGEDARDDDGDGVHAVHVKTMEGCWSLRRAWLRPPRGIAPDYLPRY